MTDIEEKTKNPLTCSEICPRKDKNCFCMSRSPKYVCECDWFQDYIRESKKMTDKEKAELYLDPIHRMYSCNNEHYTDEVILQAYLDGLAEGRKEELAYKNGYEKCLEDVYTELDKIRNSTSDFFLKNNTDEILLKLKYEFMKRR